MFGRCVCHVNYWTQDLRDPNLDEWQRDPDDEHLEEPHVPKQHRRRGQTIRDKHDGQRLTSKNSGVLEKPMEEWISVDFCSLEVAFIVPSHSTSEGQTEALKHLLQIPLEPGHTRPFAQAACARRAQSQSSTCTENKSMLTFKGSSNPRYKPTFNGPEGHYSCQEGCSKDHRKCRKKNQKKQTNHPLQVEPVLFFHSSHPLLERSPTASRRPQVHATSCSIRAACPRRRSETTSDGRNPPTDVGTRSTRSAGPSAFHRSPAVSGLPGSTGGKVKGL